MSWLPRTLERIRSAFKRSDPVNENDRAQGVKSVRDRPGGAEWDDEMRRSGGMGI